MGLCTHIVHYTLVQYTNRHSIRTIEFIQLTGKPRTICDYTRMCHCRPSAIRRRKSFTELITVYSPKSIFVVRFRARELCHHCRLRVGCTHILHASPAQRYTIVLTQTNYGSCWLTVFSARGKSLRTNNAILSPLAPRCIRRSHNILTVITRAVFECVTECFTAVVDVFQARNEHTAPFPMSMVGVSNGRRWTYYYWNRQRPVLTVSNQLTVWLCGAKKRRRLRLMYSFGVSKASTFQWLLRWRVFKCWWNVKCARHPLIFGFAIRTRRTHHTRKGIHLCRCRPLAAAAFVVATQKPQEHEQWILVRVISIDSRLLDGDSAANLGTKNCFQSA